MDIDSTLKHLSAFNYTLIFLADLINSKFLVDLLVCVFVRDYLGIG